MTSDCWTAYLPWDPDDRSRYLLGILPGNDVNIFQGSLSNPLRYPWAEGKIPDRRQKVSIAGVTVVISPYIPKGEIFLINENIPFQAYLLCRTQEELIEWMVKNGQIVHGVNIGEREC